MAIHTIEIDLPCSSYANVQTVKYALRKKKSIRIDYEDKSHLSCQFSSDLYVQEGVRILGRQGVDFGNYVRFIVNPVTLLSGTYQPLQLYTYEKGDEKTIHKVICRIAHALGIKVTKKSYRIRRIDFTVDVTLETEAEVWPTYVCCKKAIVNPLTVTLPLMRIPNMSLTTRRRILTLWNCVLVINAKKTDSAIHHR